MRRKWLPLSALVLALPGGVAADGIDDYLAREMARRKIPGLGLAVARDGEVVRVSSYGLANVETATPVTAESVFAIASLDKQITAAGLVKAAELGKLGLDDPVAKWLEVDLPGHRARRAVRRNARRNGELAALEEAVTGTLMAKFRNTGQSCIAANRIYVQRPVYAEFLRNLRDKVKALTVGGTAA